METIATAASRARLAQDDIHQQWESDYLNPEVDRFYDAAFARIVAALGDTRGKTILEVGCGYCVHTRRLARSELVITAVDFSQVPLDAAARTLAAAGIADRVTLRQADARALPFADASFDHVLIWGVLMHIPDIEGALREAVRVLRPGGKLILSENNRASLEVRVAEPLVESARRLFGRAARRRRRVRFGIEEWQAAEQGGLMVRKTDMPALVAHLAGMGLRLEQRWSGQFTELYTRAPTRALKRLIHRFNLSYFRRAWSAGPALGNILIFAKT